MWTDLGPVRIRNQTMHLLGHTAGVDVVVSRHHQSRRPYLLEPLFTHAQGQIRAIEEGVDRVPHHLREVLRWHLFQRLPVYRVILRTLWSKRGKTVVGVESVHHGLDPLGHGHLSALEELHRQIGVADHATSNVGWKN